VGSIYAISALAMLVWLIAQDWGAADLSDRALQFVLVAAAASGVWIAVSALENLGVKQSQHHWRVYKLGR
jgi:hypothetical protein